MDSGSNLGSLKYRNLFSFLVVLRNCREFLGHTINKNCLNFFFFHYSRFQMNTNVGAPCAFEKLVGKNNFLMVLTNRILSIRRGPCGSLVDLSSPIVADPY